MKKSASVILLLFLACSTAFSKTSIDTTQVFIIGGIKQFVSIKGSDRTNPLLLFLHGGPGGSVMAYADKFTKKLQEHFVVVQWDQRETGETLKLNPTNVPLTVELFHSDTRELTIALLARFKQMKLFLVGHSWGTHLGFYMAQTHPELLHGYVAVGPMVDQLESERISLNLLQTKARKDGHAVAMSELEAVRIPFENGEQLFFHRKWLLKIQESKTALSKDYVLTWAERWLTVFNEASKENLFETGLQFSCPVFLFLGRKDIQTNSEIAQAYYEKLQAPKKGIYWFEKSAHAVPTTEPTRFQEIIIQQILPQTYFPKGILQSVTR